MHKQLIIIGAGAHAGIVLEAAELMGDYTIKGFCADDRAIGEKVFGEHLILDNAMIENLPPRDEQTFFIVAVGDNDAREKFYENAVKKFTPTIIVHPRASVSTSAIVHDGAVILANACINSFSVIGKNSIVNIGTIVDHNCTIGENVQLATGTMVGNNSTVQNNFKTKLGEMIQPFSKI